MNSRSFLYPLFLLASLLMVKEARAVNGFTIFTPFDNAYIEGSTADLVLKVDDDSVDGIGLEINGNPPLLLKKRKENNIICTIMDLSQGTNKIKLTAFRGQEVAEIKEIRVYVKSPFSQSELPARISEFRFHTAVNEKKCPTCHKMEIDREDANPASPESSSCYICHKRMLKEKYIHGPAAMWLCLSCHDSKSKKGKYLIQQPNPGICYPCHKTEMDVWKKSEFEHGPFTLGDCTICHKPHASDYPFWLRMHTTDLCLTCHSDKASGAHVVSGFGSPGHPVRGKPDPRNPGKELTCASCHNPHAASNKDLLFYQGELMPGFCKTCHKF